MNSVQKMSLCSALSSTVGTMSAQTFYDAFNLVSCDYKEFSFSEMRNIFYLEEMEKWHSLLDEYKKEKVCLIRLVCFNPPSQNESDSRKENAFLRTKSMFYDCFAENDHKHIDAAMNHFPTMSIFMTLITKQRLKQKNQGTNERSIFQCNSFNKVHCLCAVNYCHHEQHTVVLWLACTRKLPFRESIHCTWRNNGLATYLLCLLIKQHTGVAENMDQSILSLQASPAKYESACRFYKKVGFSQHIDPDNGLSRTSKHFQEEVKKSTCYWISDQTMDFFQLKRGLLILPKRIKVQKEKDVFLRFPWQSSSMKKIENCVKN
jgi:hypothetical protein